MFSCFTNQDCLSETSLENFLVCLIFGHFLVSCYQIKTRWLLSNFTSSKRAYPQLKKEHYFLFSFVSGFTALSILRRSMKLMKSSLLTRYVQTLFPLKRGNFKAPDLGMISKLLVVCLFWITWILTSNIVLEVISWLSDLLQVQCMLWFITVDRLLSFLISTYGLCYKSVSQNNKRLVRNLCLCAGLNVW